MDAVLAVLILAGAFLAGRAYQWVRDARHSVGGGRR